MTRPARPAVALCLLALSAIGCDEDSVPPCPDGGTTLTWDNFAHGFMVRQCNSCHGEAVTERQGAPFDFPFDTAPQVMAHRARVYIRATGDRPTMPPGPTKPAAAERAQLAEWLQCAPP